MNLKKICVAGGRNFTDKEMLFKVLDEHIKEPCIIVSGRCEGADMLGEEYAKSKGYEILPSPAKWDDITVKGAVIKTNRFGKKFNALAGPMRNQEMCDVADELILFFGGGKGSKDMLSRAEKKGIPIKIINY